MSLKSQTGGRATKYSSDLWSRHLGAVVVRDVALADAAFITLAFRLRSKEGANALRFILQVLDSAPPPNLVRALVIVLGTAVLPPMRLQHVFDATLHPLRAVRQFGMGATAVLGGVTWQLDSVDSKHLATYFPLGVAS